MQEYKKHFPILVICLTVVVSLFVMSRTGIYIKQIGGVDSNGKISNSISVTGDGKVYAKPDMVEVSFSFSEIAPTSREALDLVSRKIDNALQIVKSNGVSDADVTTTSLNVYTEYDYMNNTRRLLGQRATQALLVKVKKIDDKATKATKIIDELSTIENVQINNITFDIEDKTKLYTQARELAFNKAKQKATELAKLADVRLQKPVSISDTTYEVTPVQVSNSALFKMDAGVGSGGGSQLPTGEVNVSANLSVLWGIE